MDRCEANLIRYFRNIAVNRYAAPEIKENTVKTVNMQKASSPEEFARINVWYGRKHSVNLYSEREITQTFGEKK